MAKRILDDVSLLYADLNLSGHANQLAFEATKDTEDCTTFDGNGWREYAATIARASANFSGFWEADANSEPDSSFWSIASGAPAIFTLTNPIAENDVAYFLQAVRSNYSQPIVQGELAKFSLGLESQSPMVRGNMIGVGISDAVGGNSAGFQTGAIPAGGKAYAVLVCTAIDTGTLDLNIESDDNSGFTTATVRASAAQLTAPGYEVIEIAGAVTDDYWRSAVTLGGGATATYYVFFGIVL